jgi:hypothetical protein
MPGEIIPKENWLEAAIDAGHRVRHVLVALWVFAVTVAAYICNGQKYEGPTGDSYNWFDVKLETLERIAELYDAVPADPAQRVDACATAGNFITGRPEHRSITFKDWWEIRDGQMVTLGDAKKSWAQCWHDKHGNDVPMRVDNAVQRAADFAIVEMLSEEATLETLKNAEKIAAEQVRTLPIPLTQIRLDVNWMGVVVGLGHSALLIWLLMSIGHFQRLSVMLGGVHRTGIGDLVGFPFHIPHALPLLLVRSFLVLFSLGIPMLLSLAICVFDWLGANEAGVARHLATVVNWTDAGFVVVTLALSVGSIWLLWPPKGAFGSAWQRTSSSIVRIMQAIRVLKKPSENIIPDETGS